MGSSPTGTPNACGVEIIDRSRRLAQTPSRKKIVSIRHGGQRPRPCDGGGIGDVISNVLVEVCISHVRLGHFSVKPGPHQQQCRSNIVECYKVECCFDMVWTGCYMWHKALHARFAIVQPIVTMRVQNYAFTKWQVLKVLLRLTRNLLVYNSRTTLTNLITNCTNTWLTVCLSFVPRPRTYATLM